MCNLLNKVIRILNIPFNPSYFLTSPPPVMEFAMAEPLVATGTYSTAGSNGAGIACKRLGLDGQDVRLEATGQGLTYCYMYAASEWDEWQIGMMKNGMAEIW
jgi:hypothetical protein